QLLHLGYAIEGSEEGHLQCPYILRTDEFGDTHRLLPPAAIGTVARVDYLHIPVGAETVPRTDIVQLAFEGMIQPGNFIPGTKVALQLESPHGGHAFRRRYGAGGKTQQTNADRKSD